MSSSQEIGNDTIVGDNGIASFVTVEGSRLLVGDQVVDLDRFKRIFVIGAGKATYLQAVALEKIIGNRITDGLVVVKDGIWGCRVLWTEDGHTRQVDVAATRVGAKVDTTGAGDLYASGFLYGYTNGRCLEDCARLGSLAAGLVARQVGVANTLMLGGAVIAAVATATLIVRGEVRPRARWDQQRPQPRPLRD